MNDIVHMVGDVNGAELPTGEVRNVFTRCGRKIDRPVVDGTPSRYLLVAENGNQFFCTTRERFVSCIKCVNLLTVGTISSKPTPSRTCARYPVKPEPGRKPGRPRSKINV